MENEQQYEKVGKQGSTFTSTIKFPKSGFSSLGKESDLFFHQNDGEYKSSAYEEIMLYSGLSPEDAIFTLGHEALIHADEDANNLNEIDNNLTAGKYKGKDGINILEQDYRNLLFSKGNRDHKNYRNGNVTKFKNYSKELGKKYSDKYEEDKKNYDSNGYFIGGHQ